MARVMVVVSGTYGGYVLHRGEVIEASAALATAIGANGRTVSATPSLVSTCDMMGEQAAAANSNQ